MGKLLRLVDSEEYHYRRYTVYIDRLIAQHNIQEDDRALFKHELSEAALRAIESGEDEFGAMEKAAEECK